MQNIVQMPLLTEIRVGNRLLHLKIVNHKVVYPGGLLRWSMEAIRDNNWNYATCEMEKHGISFEAFIEYCVMELDSADGMQSVCIFGGYHKTYTGGHVSEMHIANIRRCDNWEELIDVIKNIEQFPENIQVAQVGKNTKKGRKKTAGDTGQCRRV